MRLLLQKVSRLSCLVAGALLLAACGGSGGQASSPSPSPAPPTCDPIYQAIRLNPSDQQRAEQAGRCVEQDLTISGEVTSHVRIALRYVQVPSCDPTYNGDARGAVLNFVQGGQIYNLGIYPYGAKAGQDSDIPFDPAQTKAVELTDDVSFGNSTWRERSGTVHVNADAKSGTVDATLVRDAPGAAAVRISGTWRCGR